MKYEKQKEFFEKAYDLGGERISSGYGWPLEPTKEFLEFFEIVKKDLGSGRVLDLGCGQGRYTLFFAEQGFEAHGVDYIERAIEDAKQFAKERNLSNAHFSVGDILNVDFPENSFDIIVDSSVLDHLRPEDWEGYIHQFRRLLKKGGYVFLSEFSANDVRVSETKKNYGEVDGCYFHYFTEEELEGLFSDFLAIAKSESIGKSAPPRKDRTFINLLLKKIS